jgi:cytochrome c oxidase assembly factor CtaG
MHDSAFLEVLTAWHADPGVIAAATTTAVAYLAGAARARGGWPARRTACFLGGLAVATVVLESGLHQVGEDLLSAHMAQHLVLTLVAPPLMLLGHPLELATRALPRSAARSLTAAARGRLVRSLTRPAVGWAVFTAVLVGSHAPPVYDATLRHAALHELEHAVYLAAALLFWLPLTGAGLRPSLSPLGRILYLLGSMPPMALVGVALLTSSDVEYPPYLEGARRFAVSPVADQHTGGMIMWAGGTLVLVVATLAVGWSALRQEEQRALSRERYAPGRGA